MGCHSSKNASKPGKINANSGLGDNHNKKNSSSKNKRLPQQGVMRSIKDLDVEEL